VKQPMKVHQAESQKPFDGKARRLFNIYRAKGDGVPLVTARAGLMTPIAQAAAAVGSI
jgi:hypothetical protein